MLAGFKNFIMRGNVIELAVAFVVGAAFVIVTVNNAQFYFGAVLGAIINFLLIAAAVYFLIVLPMNKFAERRKAGIEPEPEAPAEDILLLQEIRDLLAAKRDV